MKKKHKKILISLIALGAVGATALGATLVGCTVSSRNTNSEYKKKLYELINKTKSELAFLTDDKREEVVKFIEVVSQFQNELSNKSINFKDKYNELSKLYAEFNSSIIEQEKTKLTNLIDKTKKLLESEFADEKYSDIVNQIKSLLDKNLIKPEDNFTSYVPLIQSQNEILKAVEKANSYKNKLIENEKNNQDKVAQELENKRNALIDKVNKIKDQYLKNYPSLNDFKLNSTLSPLNGLVNKILDSAKDMKVEQINENTTKLNDLLKKTLNELNTYNEDKEKSLKNYQNNLSALNELKNTLVANNSYELLDKVNTYLSTLPTKEQLSNFSKEQLDEKAEQISIVVENVVSSINEVKLKQQYLKSLYDKVIANELEKYNDYPEIKEEFKKSLDKSIDNYQNAMDMNELNNRIKSIKDANTKAKSDLEKAHNAALHEAKVEQLKNLIEFIKENQLKDYEAIKESEIKNILSELNDATTDAENNISNLNDHEIDEKINLLNNIIDKTNTSLTNYNNQKDEAIKQLNEDIKNATTLLDSLADPNLDKFKQELSKIIDDANSLDTNVSTLTDINNLSSKLNDKSTKITAIANLYEEIKKAKQEVSNALENKPEYQTIQDNFDNIVNNLLENINLDQEQELFDQNITQLLEQLNQAKDNALIDKYRTDINAEVSYWNENERLNNDFTYIESTDLASDIKTSFDNASNNQNYSLEQIKESFDTMNSKVLEGYKDILNKLVAKVEAENYNYDLYPELKTKLDKAKALSTSTNSRELQAKFTELKDEFEKVKTAERARLSSLEKLKNKIAESQTFDANTKDNARFSQIKTDIKTAINSANEGTIENLSQAEIEKRLTALTQALETATNAKAAEEKAAETNKATYESIIKQINAEEAKIMYEPLYTNIKTTMRSNTDSILNENTPKIDDLHSSTIAELNTKLSKILEDSKQAEADKYKEIKDRLTELSTQFDTKYTAFSTLVQGDQWFANKKYSNDFKNKARTYATKMKVKTDKYKEYLTSENADIFSMFGYSRSYEFLLKFMEWFENVAAVSTQDDFVIDNTKAEMLNEMINLHYNNDTTYAYRKSVLFTGASGSENYKNTFNTNIYSGYGYQKDIYKDYINKQGQNLDLRDSKNEELWNKNGLIPLIWNTQQWMDYLFSPSFLASVDASNPMFRSNLYNNIFVKAENDDSVIANEARPHVVMRRWFSAKYLVALEKQFISNKTKYPEINFTADRLLD
ncbi:hypothetical protein HUN03_00426 [Mycoplasmopsis anatis]|uniref:hypothetical protein n=1 Tax=Mycoplasmopsis anatis TaxID=171279 RepID=UPI001C4E2055|nr:hypothetical protein [Mycoplasmopsis anatis]MBW0594771.1 hypothetical protein [Mycoplasmopsis anatis]MBW0595562.1 hypothetical protein [Mycoplasmopsis anatis]MBW0598360.1 hypothetical protein [Mycoplasmopsis anatis]MBW0599102.1 hypothetical protein [Mycoplasmopsis anatis]MBW0601322.1 hypothetical protein [Mycoplasmopsis anatis]